MYLSVTNVITRYIRGMKAHHAEYSTLDLTRAQNRTNRTLTTTNDVKFIVVSPFYCRFQENPMRKEEKGKRSLENNSSERHAIPISILLFSSRSFLSDNIEGLTPKDPQYCSVLLCKENVCAC